MWMDVVRVRRVPFYHRERVHRRGGRKGTHCRAYIRRRASDHNLHKTTRRRRRPHAAANRPLPRPPLTPPLLAPLPPPFLYARPLPSQAPPRPTATNRHGHAQQTKSPLGPLLMTTHARTNNDNDNKLCFFLLRLKRNGPRYSLQPPRGIHQTTPKSITTHAPTPPPHPRPYTVALSHQPG